MSCSMKILLDTQVFIWMVNQDRRLGKKSRELVRSTKNHLSVSFLSFFEMAIKASIGKLQFDPSILQDLEKMGVQLLSGDHESLARYQIFTAANKDPFDNYLMATAMAKNMKLLTSDARILGVKQEGLEVINALR